jgi:hypothetical protein
VAIKEVIQKRFLTMIAAEDQQPANDEIRSVIASAITRLTTEEKPSNKASGLPQKYFGF